MENDLERKNKLFRKQNPSEEKPNDLSGQCLIRLAGALGSVSENNYSSTPQSSASSTMANVSQ